MKPAHVLLAVAVMVVWGTNFVVMKIALNDLPPLLLATLRFTLAFLPIALFLPRPAVPWRNLASYGVLIGVGQFGLIFVAMRSDITPGLAATVVQMQVFFTILFAARLNGERVRPFQFAALALAVGGLAVILTNANGSATPLGIILVIGGALSWAMGNMVAKAAGAPNMLNYVVWSSAFAVPPLFALSLMFEGWPTMVSGVARADAETWGAVVWQAVGNTMFGYAAWGWLLARYPAATVAPMSLLVPVIGLAASAWWLAEPLPLWKVTAAVLVLAGLALGLIWPLAERVRARHGKGIAA